MDSGGMTPVQHSGYTDAPKLHEDLLLGSLQLIGWFIFYPSAWRSHVERFDRSSPLTWTHEWRNLDRWGTLIVGSIVYLCYFAFRLALSRNYLLFIEMTRNAAFAIGTGGLFGAAGVIAFGVRVGVPFVAVVGPVIGVLAFSVSAGMAFGMACVLTAGFAATIPPRRTDWESAEPGAFVLGTMIGAVVYAWGLLLVLDHKGVTGVLAVSAGAGVAFSTWFRVYDLTSDSFDARSVGILIGAFGATSLGCMAGFLFGQTHIFWRPVLIYPLSCVWNWLLYFIDRGWCEQPILLRLNSAFWDEMQEIPLYGLARHLAFTIEHNPDEGRAAMRYLSTSRQRWAAQVAQIELDAKLLERCEDVHVIGLVHTRLAAGELQGPFSVLLRSFSRISQDTEAALQQDISAFNQRLALRAVADRLDGLLRDLTRSGEQYAIRFTPVAERWQRILADKIRTLAKQVEQRQQIDNPYIIAVPLTVEQEIFIGRADIVGRIEQLLLDRRRPPVLLYGQRRMGKTSLLRNLGRLLPSTLCPLFVDLQNPAISGARDIGGLFHGLCRDMTRSADEQRGLRLPPVPQAELSADPFPRFEQWLDEVERTLGDGTALLCLDEFEALDRALSAGRFDQDLVLGMLRHLIQHRPRFKVLIAGSHTLDELRRWASYLINVQVVKLSYLKEDEARQLIERPVRDFTLRYQPDAAEKALALTRGHPFLVQLLCSEIVTHKNEQPPSVRRLADIADVEAAVPEALSQGELYFADLENQIDAAAVELLRRLAHEGPGARIARDAADAHIAQLLRRDLLEESETGYSFQVEMIRRYFARPARP